MLPDTQVGKEMTSHMGLLSTIFLRRIRSARQIEHTADYCLAGIRAQSRTPRVQTQSRNVINHIGEAKCDTCIWFLHG